MLHKNGSYDYFCCDHFDEDTKLQRFSIKLIYSTSPYMRSKLTSYSNSALNFTPRPYKIFPKPRNFGLTFCSLNLRHSQVFFTSIALLSMRFNFVKMIATQIFIRTTFEEHSMPNIFCNLTFFSKVHILRENCKNLRRVHVLTRSAKGDGAEGGAFLLATPGVILRNSQQ